jgi:hypothetical protein
MCVILYLLVQCIDSRKTVLKCTSLQVIKLLKPFAVLYIFKTKAGIFKKSMGARNQVGIGLSYRPAKLYSDLRVNIFGQRAMPSKTENSLIKKNCSQSFNERSENRYLAVTPTYVIKLMRPIAYSLWTESVPTYVLSSMLKNAVEYHRT